MTEVVEPGTITPETEPKPRRKLKIKISDVIALVIIVAVIIGLSVFIVNKITLKHDVADARIVADKVIADLQKRDGAAAYKLGNKKFQKSYTADALTKQFKAVEVATLKKPALDRTTVSSDKHAVVFVYKYTALKVPYYVRVILSDKAGPWQLTNISGNADESQLLVQ
jgi:hypothetical protein